MKHYNSESNSFMKQLKRIIKKIREFLAIRWVNNTLLAICIAVFLFSAWGIYKYYDDNRRAAIANEQTISAAGVDNTTSQSPEGEEVIAPIEGDDGFDDTVQPPDYSSVKYMATDFTDLLSKNPDVVACLRVNGTKILFPIVQAKDNKYYLTHSFDKSYNNAGWPFADYRNSFVNFNKNTIIYGHARPAMFGSLLNTQKEWWYSKTENHLIRLNTLDDQTVWQIFSIYVIPVENYYIQTAFANSDDFMKFANTLKDRSKVKVFNVPLDETDKILTLSTCSGSNNEERLVVHAKLIKSAKLEKMRSTVSIPG